MPRAIPLNVNGRAESVTVKHSSVAHDCGQIINPDGVKNLIEGDVLQPVSA